MRDIEQIFASEIISESKPILIRRFMDIKKKPDIQPALEDFTYDLGNESSRTHLLMSQKRRFFIIWTKVK